MGWKWHIGVQLKTEEFASKKIRFLSIPTKSFCWRHFRWPSLYPRGRWWGNRRFRVLLQVCFLCTALSRKARPRNCRLPLSGHSQPTSTCHWELDIKKTTTEIEDHGYVTEIKPCVDSRRQQSKANLPQLSEFCDQTLEGC